MRYLGEKRVELVENIKNNIIDKTHIKNAELAKSMARGFVLMR